MSWTAKKVEESYNSLSHKKSDGRRVRSQFYSCLLSIDAQLPVPFNGKFIGLFCNTHRSSFLHHGNRTQAESLIFGQLKDLDLWITMALIATQICVVSDILCEILKDALRSFIVVHVEYLLGSTTQHSENCAFHTRATKNLHLDILLTVTIVSFYSLHQMQHKKTNFLCPQPCCEVVPSWARPQHSVKTVQASADSPQT